MLQLVPFQRSASVFVVLPVTKSPTASHALADAQETSLSWLLVAPRGLGVAWMLQPPPFQVSASVSLVLPLTNKPTAVHAVAEVHEIPVSCPALASWMLMTVHVPPLSRSASRWLPVLSLTLPTAMHALEAVHDTALKLQVTPPGGTGVACSSQLAAAGCATARTTGITSAVINASRLIPTGAPP